MKKLFLIIFFITIVSLNAFAVDNDSINHDIDIQKRIDSIGFNDMRLELNNLVL